MKKAICLFLALALCAVLGACGAKEAPEVDKIQDFVVGMDVPETEVMEATEQEKIQLEIGDTYSFPAFDITITGFDFSEKASFPDGEGHNLLPQKGYVTANLYYDIKYTGKTTMHSSFISPNWLDYNDGYSFDITTFYYYDNGVEAWLNSGDIDPLTPEFSCKACFFVPEEVKNEEGNPLFIDFYLNSFIVKIR